MSGGGGGGGGPTQQTITQTNIPEWLRPQVETTLGGAMQQIFNTRPVTTTDPQTGESTTTQEVTGVKPYVPYSVHPEDYVAGLSPLQQQAMANTANIQVPGQYQGATDLASAAGQGALSTVGPAMAYGRAGYGSGQLGQQLGILGGQYYGGLGAGYGAQAAGMAPQAQGYGLLGAGYGGQAAGLAPQAQTYGRTAADIGAMGLQAQDYGMGVGQQARGYAQQSADMGALYGAMATDPYTYQAYMSPYMQNVVGVQQQDAQRQADIAKQALNAQFAQAGAFGGARRDIQQGVAAEALARQKAAIQAQGLQSAYQQAQGNILNRAQLGLQGYQGAQQGLGTALQGGQLGLSGIGQAMAGQQAGLSGLGQAGQLYGLGMQGAQSGLAGLLGANQLYGTGIQGAGMGLQGVQQQLAGTSQGMQGAGVGLQGVSGAQSGYGMANQAAQNLANIGTQQLGAQTGIIGLQSQQGAIEQQQQQNIINQAIQNYATAQQYPLQQYNAYNALLRGYAIPGQSTTQYQAAPSLAGQLTGLGTAAFGASKLMGAGQKKGGVIKKPKASTGIDTLALSNALKAA